MSEKEKQILKTMKEAISTMSDFDKGYLLGFSESRVSEKREAGKQEKSTTEKGA